MSLLDLFNLFDLLQKLENTQHICIGVAPRATRMSVVVHPSATRPFRGLADPPPRRHNVIQLRWVIAGAPSWCSTLNYEGAWAHFHSLSNRRRFDMCAAVVQSLLILLYIQTPAALHVSEIIW